MREPSIVLSPFPHHFRHIQKRKVKPQIGKLYGHAATPSDVMSGNDKLFLRKHYYFHDPEGFNESV